MKILSGGQTGVDRAALDVALSLHIDCGGWCPRGRSAEDGTIPQRYPLRETESEGGDERTRRNVEDSDGTLILARDAKLEGGTALTAEYAAALGRPLLVLIEHEDLARAESIVREFVRKQGIGVLNIAGPRESEAPGLERWARRVLLRALG